MMVASDTAATAGRARRLAEYMGQHVLAVSGTCVCRRLGSCQRAVLFDRRGTSRPEVDFAAGQLSHVGRHYDLMLDGVPCRILVIAMETARLRESVTLDQRYVEVMDSARLPYRDRNPHMKGVANALRLALGREPGDDRKGEHLRVDGLGRPVHIFDAFALGNLRLCSATVGGDMKSLSNPTMSRNCLPHLAATIKILEPTLCIVQGVQVHKTLTEVMSSRRSLAPHLEQVRLAGVDTLVADFTSPSAWGTQGWGGLTHSYLRGTVAPALRVAHQLMRDPSAPAGNPTVQRQRRHTAANDQVRR
ncbi:hypothetical protein [Micromonospora costi]|uniref:Uracil-DNA glycosylase-like domain-containing protein n=1 Tax=Micromonospora costi TaxID=1530042 RepID=A0A3A9ZW53_9ACTN|nr:hypothetical protein [Micromonospora costi]RKN52648.1 hypothetical protein D7193_22610 [Micromonospora costi]